MTTDKRDTTRPVTNRIGYDPEYEGAAYVQQSLVHKEKLIFLDQCNMFLSPSVFGINCHNAILHELGHCYGLEHNDYADSIMNISILMSQDGNWIPAPFKIGLSHMDIISLYYSNYFRVL